jgi:rhodanese-related sulfurtransferase
MKQLTASQLSQRLTDTSQTAPVLLDVREPWEFALCAIPGSVNMPMKALPARYLELNEDAEIVLICHHGMRSYQCGVFLERQGFGGVINLAGGVAAWAEEVDTDMPRY